MACLAAKLEGVGTRSSVKLRTVSVAGEPIIAGAAIDGPVAAGAAQIVSELSASDHLGRIADGRLLDRFVTDVLEYCVQTTAVVQGSGIGLQRVHEIRRVHVPRRNRLTVERRAADLQNGLRYRAG